MNEISPQSAILNDDNFEQFTLRYKGLIFSAIHEVIRLNSETEDIIQLVLLKVWKYAHLYSPEKGSVVTWVAKVARNTAIDYARRASMQGKGFLRAYLTDPYTFRRLNRPENKTSLTPYDVYRLKQEINKLSTKSKTTLYDNYFEGYSHEELAKKDNLPLGTIKTRIRIGLHRLRDIYGVPRDIAVYKNKNKEALLTIK